MHMCAIPKRSPGNISPGLLSFPINGINNNNCAIVSLLSNNILFDISAPTLSRGKYVADYCQILHLLDARSKLRDSLKFLTLHKQKVHCLVKLPASNSSNSSSEIGKCRPDLAPNCEQLQLFFVLWFKKDLLVKITHTWIND